MTRKPTLATLLLSLIFSGCEKDYLSSTETFIINETEFPIFILPYRYGVVDSGEYVNLKPGERKSVYRAKPLGKTVEPCWGTLLQSYDSVIVMFASSTIRKTIHLNWRDSSTVCTNCITYNENRNLSNTDNFVKTITRDHKNYLFGYFEYTFTEEDYTFASE